MKKTTSLLACLLLLSVAAISQKVLPVSTQIRVEQGLLEGRAEDDLKIFKGIPFAAPPVGPLRWKAPQAPAKWEGVRACTAFSASPVQGSPKPFMCWSEEFLIPAEPIDEDCLYLNVWTAAAQTTEKRPVLVYIYGGGFMSGGSACPIYDGAAMARRGVVFVSINYRVGIFGFLAHPELSQEGPYHSSGNYALLDMIAALQWVQQNIGAFGGDPGNVTIAGQSAGAFAVNYLTCSPLAKGLFQRAIAQSGAQFYTGVRGPARNLATAEQEGLRIAAAMNCPTLTELRAKPAGEILKNASGFFSPIVDGYTVKETIAETYAAGRQNDVPVLIGWNADDLVAPRTPTTSADFKQAMQERFGDAAADFFAAYPADTDSEATRSKWGVMRDEFFGVQMYGWAHAQTKTGESPVFMYNFNRELPAATPETQFGAFHSGEIVYAYDNLHTLHRPWEDADRRIADMMAGYWVNFARSGNPNGTSLPPWEAYNPVQEKVLILDQNVRSVPLPDQKKLMFWEKYFIAGERKN